MGPRECSMTVAMMMMGYVIKEGKPPGDDWIRKAWGAASLNFNQMLEREPDLEQLVRDADQRRRDQAAEAGPR